MQKAETKHRKYQVLKWIEALEGGYPDGRSAYPPTLSNLTLHMLEADVRKDAMIRLYGRGALRKPYNKRMVNYFKAYLNNLMGRYQRRLFNIRKMPKSERNTYAFEAGVERKKYHIGHKVKAYFLSTQGRRELDELHAMAQEHHEMTPTTYRQDSVDKLIVPKDQGRGSWWPTEIVLRRGTRI